MDGERFDAIIRAFARRSSRRGIVRGGVALGVGAFAAAVSRHASPTLAANDACASFCQQLPPGPVRGQCIAEAAQGQGLCAQCGPLGQPDTGQQLCGDTCTDTSSDATNCGSCGTTCPAGQPCVGGVCGCPENYQYCPGSDSCVFDNCAFNYRVTFDASTCGCMCQEEYIALPGGGCGIACSQDADCPGAGEYGTFCGTTTEGLQVCTARSTFVQNPNCTSSEQCYAEFNHGINTFCVAGLCRAAV